MFTSTTTLQNLMMPSVFYLKTIPKHQAMHILKKPNLLKSIFYSTMLDIGEHDLSFKKIKNKNYIMTDNTLTENLEERFYAYFPDSWNKNQTVNKNYNLSSKYIHLLKYEYLKIPIDFNYTNLEILPI